MDKNEINYGSQVLGETCKKTIMLINDGALATKFNIKKVPAEPPSDVITSLPESVKPFLFMLNCKFLTLGLSNVCD